MKIWTKICCQLWLAVAAHWLDNKGVAHVVNYDLVMLPIDWTTKELLLLSTMTWRCCPLIGHARPHHAYHHLDIHVCFSQNQHGNSLLEPCIPCPLMGQQWSCPCCQLWLVVAAHWLDNKGVAHVDNCDLQLLPIDWTQRASPYMPPSWHTCLL